MFPILEYFRLKYLLIKLGNQKKLPPIIRVTHENNLITALFCEKDLETNMFANPTAGAGTADNLVIASLKGLSEYAERLAFQEQPAHIRAYNSTGFAAYPNIFYLKHTVIKHARYHAFYEAYERYIWQRWWSNKNIAAKITILNDLSARDQEAILPLVNSAKSIAKIKEIFVIEPKVEPSHCVIIVAAKLEPYGIIAGGAASDIKNRSKSLKHAMVEMVRHIKTYRRAHKLNIAPKTIYEKKLLYFAAGKGDDKFAERINYCGHETIATPKLAIDTGINHSLAKYFYVHQCIFHEQFSHQEVISDLVY